MAYMNTQSFVGITVCLLIFSTRVASAAEAVAEVWILPQANASVTRQEIRDVNEDGSMLVGTWRDGSGNWQPAYWLEGSGWQAIPGVGPAQAFQMAQSMSDDGRSIGGRFINENGDTEGFRYTFLGQGFERLGGVPGAASTNLKLLSRPSFMAPEGNQITGQIMGTGVWSLPGIWEAGSGWSTVPLPAGWPGGWLYAQNTALDRGVGALFKWDQQLNNGAGGVVEWPAGWTVNEGMRALPLPEGATGGWCLAISDNGRYGGGYYSINGVTYAAKWDLDDDTLTTLATLSTEPLEVYAHVNHVSDDGQTLLGYATLDPTPNQRESGDESFSPRIWTAGGAEVQDFKDYAAANWGLQFPADYHVRDISMRFGVYHGALQRLSDGLITGYIIKFHYEPEGFTLLGDAPGGLRYSQVRGLSRDGNTAVGLAHWHDALTVPSAWISGEGWQQLPFPENAGFTWYFLTASDITPDGRFSVGRTASFEQVPVAVRYNIASGTVETLPGIATGKVFSRASGISDSGNIIVGQAADASDILTPVMWLSTNGQQFIPLPLSSLGDRSDDWAYSVSGDGTTIVGWSSENEVPQPVTWTQTGSVLTQLPLISGATGGSVLAASRDGKVLVGSNFVAGREVPVYWDNGSVNRINLPSGFEGGVAWSVSADGTLIGGQIFTYELPTDTIATDIIGFVHRIGTPTAQPLQEFLLEHFSLTVDTTVEISVAHVNDSGTMFYGSLANPLSRLPGLEGYVVRVGSATLLQTIPDATEVSPNWVSIPWFGDLNIAEFPLAFHEQHGWIQIGKLGADDLYFYDLKLGWLTADSATYPNLARIRPDGSTQWLFYDTNSDSPRRFWDYSAESADKWRTEDQLAE